MREIKFRAWDKDKNMFIPTEVWAVVTTDFNAFGVMIKDWQNYREGEYFYSNSQELSQFTGLYDRNGNEIYEGDICNFCFEEHGAYSKQYKGIVSFDHCRFELYDYLIFELSLIEIIGNIYENPELL